MSPNSNIFVLHPNICVSHVKAFYLPKHNGIDVAKPKIQKLNAKVILMPKFGLISLMKIHFSANVY